MSVPQPAPGQPNWVRTLAVTRSLIVWTLITVAVLLVKVSGWLQLGLSATVGLVMITTATGVAVVVVVARTHEAARASWMLWFSAATVVAGFGVVVWLQFHSPDASRTWFVQFYGAFVVAWCLSLERVFSDGEGSRLVQFAVIGTFGFIEAALAFAAWWFIVPWTLNVTLRGPGMPGWVWQSGLLFVLTGVLLMLTGSRRRWPMVPRGWSRRDGVTIIISAVALFVSFVTFIYPVASEAVRERVVAQQYLSNLTAGSSHWARVAARLAEPGSPAEGFAERMQWIIQGTEAGASPGSLDSNGSFQARFSFCLPDLPTLPSDCATADNFVYSEAGRVMDFELDGIPVAALFESNNLTDQQWVTASDAGQHQVKVAQAASLSDVHGGSTTVVMLVRSSDPERFELSDVHLTGVDGKPRSVTWYPLTPGVSDYSYYWAFNAPVADGSLRLCFTIVAQSSPSCLDYFVVG